MDRLLEILPARPQPLIVRYGATALIIAVCFLIVLGLRPRQGVLGFFFLLPTIFFVGIFAASILFDHASGILATALSTLLIYCLTRSGETQLEPGEFILPVGAFVLASGGLAIVSEAMRSAWERAAATESTKDLLLQELGHRTKNNLAMVASMLSLQARTKTNPEVAAALDKAVARVQAIASAHDHFQRVEHDGRVEMRSYLDTLCGHLGDSLRDVRPIAVRTELDDVHLPPEQAVPLGLIVNELVTNALKHAFPDDRGGTVKVALRQGSPFVLTVEDNGVGCPAGKEERLGSRLTRLLAGQLGATIAWENAEPGCRVRLRFAPA